MVDSWIALDEWCFRRARPLGPSSDVDVDWAYNICLQQTAAAVTRLAGARPAPAPAAAEAYVMFTKSKSGFGICVLNRMEDGCE